MKTPGRCLYAIRTPVISVAFGRAGRLPFPISKPPAVAPLRDLAIVMVEHRPGNAPGYLIVLFEVAFEGVRQDPQLRFGPLAWNGPEKFIGDPGFGAMRIWELNAARVKCIRSREHSVLLSRRGSSCDARAEASYDLYIYENPTQLLQMLRDVVGDVFRRRVPQVLALYLGASWAAIEAFGFAVEHYGFSPLLVDVTIALLISLTPSVVALGYFHGAPGRQSWSGALKIGVPINLVVSFALVSLVILRDASRYKSTLGGDAVGATSLIDLTSSEIPDSIKSQLYQSGAVPTNERIQYVFIPQGLSVDDALVLTDERLIRVTPGGPRAYDLDSLGGRGWAHGDSGSLVFVDVGSMADTLFSNLTVYEGQRLYDVLTLIR